MKSEVKQLRGEGIVASQATISVRDLVKLEKAAAAVEVATSFTPFQVSVGNVIEVVDDHSGNIKLSMRIEDFIDGMSMLKILLKKLEVGFPGDEGSLFV